MSLVAVLLRSRRRSLGGRRIPLRAPAPRRRRPPLRRGGGELRPRQRSGLVGLGNREALRRAHRGLLERQFAVAIGVELGKGLASRREEFVARDAAVAILVEPIEPPRKKRRIAIETTAAGIEVAKVSPTFNPA
jgi:hypothetical protein